MDRLRIAVDGGANRLFDEAPSVLPHLTAELVCICTFTPQLSLRLRVVLCDGGGTERAVLAQLM